MTAPAPSTSPVTAVDELRDADYAAERLHVDRVTVLRYARRGLIGSVLIGRKRFFRDRDLQEFIDRQAQAAGRVLAPVSPAPASVRPARNPNRSYKT